MKSLAYLSQVFLLLLLLTGCGGKGKDPTPTQTANFQVDIRQTGDYTKFVRIITISGGDVRFGGTNEKAPAVLMGDDLNKSVITLEARNAEELEITALTEFSAVETGPATMELKFVVSKNNEHIETKTFTYDETTKGKSEVLTYKAN